MRTKKIALSALGTLAIAAGVLWAADHIDAPAVTGTTSDITDYYAFQGQDTDNLVFVANVQGLLTPAATGGAAFDENVMVEFNIDNDGDFIEDLVIQAIVQDGKVKIYGPIAPSAPGQLSSVTGDIMVEADVTSYGASAIVGTSNDMMVFAGPRDDPFFMDFAKYGDIIAGNATEFDNPGNDTFAGSNVMSIVVELPKSALNPGATASLNTWVESKRKM